MRSWLSGSEMYFIYVKTNLAEPPIIILFIYAVWSTRFPDQITFRLLSNYATDKNNFYSKPSQYQCVLVSICTHIYVIPRQQHDPSTSTFFVCSSW
jgi:hypothetical protein